jgi:hypothetical protein
VSIAADLSVKGQSRTRGEGIVRSALSEVAPTFPVINSFKRTTGLGKIAWQVGAL